MSANQSVSNTTNAVIQTVIIDTPHMQQLAHFYGAGFELGPPAATGDDHLGFSMPGAYFGFDLVDQPRDDYPGAVSVWFEVDDLEATFQRFVDLGAEVKFPPTKKPWGATLAAVLDPDGNIVGLSQRGTFPEMK